MLQRQSLDMLARAVAKRCLINVNTVKAVLPAFIDEVRFQLSEGKLSVPIESFGTFAMIEIPEREHQYTYKGVTTMKHLPPKKKIKFSPARSFRREIESGHFDPTRHSFSRHPKDPVLRNRAQMAYHNERKDQISKGKTTFISNRNDEKGED